MESFIEKGTKFHAAESVSYTPQSVVSRQVLKNERGNITLFAFGKGEGLSEHTAPFDAMVLVLEGTAEVVIGGKPNLVQTGEAVIMPANIPHALKAVEQFKMMLVMIRG